VDRAGVVLWTADLMAKLDARLVSTEAEQTRGLHVIFHDCLDSLYPLRLSMQSMAMGHLNEMFLASLVWPSRICSRSRERSSEGSRPTPKPGLS
jgi:hypothetical protein